MAASLLLALSVLASAAAALLTPQRGASTARDRSVALPFLDRPVGLDGSMAGDFGFDPLGLATADNLPRLRECELRHGRLAMVACWGWPVAELGYGVARELVPISAVCNGNGCAWDAAHEASELSLDQIASASIVYWTSVVLLAVGGELLTRRRRGARGELGEPVADALGLYRDAEDAERRRLELAELKHARLAMSAVLARGALMLAAGCQRARPSVTLAHQLWGDTCVYNLLDAGKGACIDQCARIGPAAGVPSQPVSLAGQRIARTRSPPAGLCQAHGNVLTRRHRVARPGRHGRWARLHAQLGDHVARRHRLLGGALLLTRETRWEHRRDHAAHRNRPLHRRRETSTQRVTSRRERYAPGLSAPPFRVCLVAC